MSAKRVKAAEGVILAALVGRDPSASGIAAALEAAGLLQSPETAEALRLQRDRIAELEADTEKVAKFCAARAEYVDNINNCSPSNDRDYWRWNGHAEARRQLSQLLGLPVAWPAEDAATPITDGNPLTSVPQQRGGAR
ncbi:hypothetical protein [Streptomyces sp. NPDC126503]|uniref:hypothetical protein n=1 Tax=Streptomyces sp. NPDC126503 TaxID=3155315 RepID=UPI00331D3EE5